MLSIEKCREILGDEYAGLSDERLAQIRDELSELARIALDAYIKKQKQGKIANNS
ncbi:MAG: hypothetical protein KGI50_00420 [Patescibacteria group bacterium]|nr:hypothetical protein [Patescibacteria group bacterium]MDE2438180.1 hypothetical protein [Patescibacteria group bacterium]